MSLLIRKINRNRWLEEDEVPNDVPADAITGCMRTQRNTLSVWEVPDEGKIDEAVKEIGKITTIGPFRNKLPSHLQGQLFGYRENDKRRAMFHYQSIG